MVTQAYIPNVTGPQSSPELKTKMMYYRNTGTLLMNIREIKVKEISVSPLSTRHRITGKLPIFLVHEFY